MWERGGGNPADIEFAAERREVDDRAAGQRFSLIDRLAVPALPATSLTVILSASFTFLRFLSAALIACARFAENLSLSVGFVPALAVGSWS